MKRILITIAMLLALTLTAFPAMAQDGDVPVRGDAESTALATVRAYLEEGFSEEHLADDVVYEDPVIADTVEDVDTLTETPTLFYGESFENVEIDPVLYVVGDNTVAAEFFFIGDQTGPYYAMAASGQNVAFQAAAFFEVSEDQITAMRLYFDLATLNAQAGYAPVLGAPVPAVPGGDFEIVDVDDIVKNLDDYAGETVRVTGDVDEVLNDWALVLQDEDIIDLTGQESLLVLAGPSGVFEFSYEEGANVSIIGTVRDASFEDLQSELGYAMDMELLSDYEDWAIVVTEVNFE